MAKQPNFLSSSTEHHAHIVRLLILIGVLLVIVVVGWIATRPRMEVYNEPPQPVVHQLSDADRLALLSQPSDIAPIDPTLTDAQRYKLLNKASSIPPIK